MTDITVTDWQDFQNTPLHDAAYDGEIEKLRFFAGNGYPHYNIKDEEGLTPLHLAAQMVGN